MSGLRGRAAAGEVQVFVDRGPRLILTALLPERTGPEQVQGGVAGGEGLPVHGPVQEPKGFFGIAAIRFNGRERGGGPPGNGVHAFGGEPVQRREDRGGIVQTPHPVIQIPQNGQCAALFLRERHLNPLSSGPCRR